MRTYNMKLLHNVEQICQVCFEYNCDGEYTIIDCQYHNITLIHYNFGDVHNIDTLYPFKVF